VEHEHWMQTALELAKEAALAGEVPVGAVVVYENVIIGRGYNRPIQYSDPTAHAEIIAIREAALHVSNYRLTNASLYTTLEPCAMCAGAIVHARINHVFYGARDPRAGSVESAIQIFDCPTLNHRPGYKGGVLGEDARALLLDFFQSKRF